ncbi:hypothetical protein [Streptomyces chilikensis]|uniref:hypothetical protein n=1 Tax=Streptomyces chilikensis TaxID=1194079 RepID=UPI000AB5E7A7|nr:hypothetical protein [Streptomyces chilikensis]
MEEDKEIEKIWENLSDEAQELLNDVLRVERENLHYNKPEGIVEKIVAKIEGIIK